MKTQIFIRCHLCKNLKGCDLDMDGAMSCSNRKCSDDKKCECEEKMQLHITNNTASQFAGQCAICAYKFARQNHIAFASDE